MKAKENEIRDLGKDVVAWNVWILLALLFTAAAAALTFFVQRKQFQAADKLASAQEELGTAKEAVLRFDTDAATTQAADANKAAGTANERAHKLSLEASELAVKAKSLELQVEQERIARLKIEQFFSQREISPEQEARLLEELKPLKGEKIPVYFTLATGEVRALYDRLLGIMGKAEIDVSEHGYHVTPETHTGIWFDAGKNRMPTVLVLAHAFREVGLSEDNKPLDAVENPNPDFLQVKIGPKH